MLDLALILALSETCAPGVSPQTMAAVAYTESRFNPLAIGVNGSSRLSRKPGTAAEAAQAARALIDRGASIDLGLAQINSANLAWLDLTVEEAFDPCRNLAAAGKVLRAGYRPQRDETPRQSLRVALSRYNTGHPNRGFRNGYVARVEASARILGLARTAAEPELPKIEAAITPRQRAVAGWDVFGRAPSVTVLVFASTETLPGGLR